MSSVLTSSDGLYFTDRGSGPPILLVHGLMVTGEMFDSVRDRLAARHRVIVPDLRGHGRSRKLPPPYSVPQLAADLSHVLQDLGIESTAVLGYSQGGAVAQQLALDFPERCDCLVLACTYAFNMATPREKVEGHIAPALVRVLGPRHFAKLGVSLGAKELDKERADWLAGLMGGQDRKLMVAAWQKTMSFDSRKRLAEIACPTLVIAGSRDQAVPIHHAKMLHDRIAGSQLVVVNGAGHTLIWTNPDEFVHLVEEFLGGAGKSDERRGRPQPS
jgi:3-oxoadipate enol-lactonase